MTAQPPDDLDFDVNPEDAQKLNQGLQIGGAVELPFTAPLFYWKNGNPQLRDLAAQTPVKYFGGWVCRVDQMEPALEERKGLLPGGFVKTQLTADDGSRIDAFTGRMLMAAPVTYRLCWMKQDGAAFQRDPNYFQGASRRIQVLALLGVKINRDDPRYTPWGPVVLSAHGRQVDVFLDVMRTWRMVIERTRKAVAPAVPAWAFYMCLGTFGDDLEQVKVGKNQQSPITPMHVFVPKDIGRETLRELYVGKEQVTKMAQWLEGAMDWLAVWRKSQTPAAAKPSQGRPADGGREAEPEFDDYVPGAGDMDGPEWGA